MNNKDILEADFVVEFNDIFHTIYAELKEEYGEVSSRRHLAELEAWIKRKIKEGRYA